MKLSFENVLKYFVYNIKTLESSVLSACIYEQEFHEYLSSWIVMHVHQVRLLITHAHLNKTEAAFSGPSLKYHNSKVFILKQINSLLLILF